MPCLNSFNMNSNRWASSLPATFSPSHLVLCSKSGDPLKRRQKTHETEGRRGAGRAGREGIVRKPVRDWQEENWERHSVSLGTQKRESSPSMLSFWFVTRYVLGFMKF